MMCLSSLNSFIIQSFFPRNLSFSFFPSFSSSLRERRRGIDRIRSSIHWFTSQGPQQPELSWSVARGQKLLPYLSYGCRIISTRVIPQCTPRHINRELALKWSIQISNKHQSTYSPHVMWQKLQQTFTRMVTCNSSVVVVAFSGERLIYLMLRSIYMLFSKTLNSV